jgi:hypothetical protein
MVRLTVRSMIQKLFGERSMFVEENRAFSVYVFVQHNLYLVERTTLHYKANVIGVDELA